MNLSRMKWPQPAHFGTVAANGHTFVVSILTGSILKHLHDFNSGYKWVNGSISID